MPPRPRDTRLAPPAAARTARERFLKQDVEYQVRTERHGQERQRWSCASVHQRQAGGGKNQQARGQLATRPTERRRRSTAPAELPRRRRRPQHLDSGEIFGALIEQRVPVRRRPAGEDHERNRPDRDPRDEMPLNAIAANRARRAVRCRTDGQEQQRKRQPRDLRANADRQAGAEALAAMRPRSLVAAIASA